MISTYAHGTASGLSQFFLGSHVRSFEKDKEQKAHCNFILYHRETILASSLERASMKVPYLGWGAIAIGVTKAALQALEKLEESFPHEIKIPSPISFASKSVHDLLDTILDHGDTLFNVALVVSYTAMIAFGHPIPGVIGFAFLGLTILKVNKLFPDSLEKQLTPLSLISSLYLSATLPGILFRAFHLSVDLIHLTKYLEKKFPAFFETLVENNPGKHIKKPLKQGDKDFIFNQTSLHAPTPGNILSKEMQAKLKTVSTDDLFKELEDLNVPCSKSGWQNLKDALTKGTTVDEAPVNFEKFCEVLKALLLVVSEKTDPLEKENAIKDLAEIGDSCSTGWTRDISFQLEPKSRDIAWCVHKHLAIFRDELLLQKLLMLQESHKNAFAISGKADNIHLAEQVARALWHKWRTDLGETYFTLNGRSVVLKFLQNLSNAGREEVTILTDGLISGSSLEPSSVFIAPFIPEIDFYLEDSYNTRFILDKIYDAIKPTYPEVRGKREIRRSIEWDSVTGWIAKMGERGWDMTLESGEYNPKYVKYDVISDKEKHPYLTKDGVILLLADIGVLEKA